MKVRRFFGALANAGSFFAAFLLACLVIHPLLPIPNINQVQAKLEWIKAHPEGFDTLFIGTSRIYHHILPSRFDQLMAERGVPTHSFNAGIDAMRAPEDAYMLDQILRLHRGQLRWVFLESNAVRPLIDEDKRNTNRLVYWHDWERLSILFHEEFDDRKESKHLRGVIKNLWDPAGEFLAHAGIFVQNTVNYGRGCAPLGNWLNPDFAPIDWRPLGPKEDGFAEIPLPKADEMTKNLAELRRDITLRRQRPTVPDDGSAASQAALRTMLKKIAEAHATAVLIIPPTTASKVFRPVPGSATAPLFDFCNLEKYPELYEERVRLDTSHMNTAGAEIFTRLLADQFAGWVKGQGGEK